MFENNQRKYIVSSFFLMSERIPVNEFQKGYIHKVYLQGQFPGRLPTPKFYWRNGWEKQTLRNTGLFIK